MNKVSAIKLWLKYFIDRHIVIALIWFIAIVFIGTPVFIVVLAIIHSSERQSKCEAGGNVWLSRDVVCIRADHIVQIK
jgi:ABC-type lipoprotein release transport system permease subunit